MKPRQGFVLIEAIVALVILSVVFTGCIMGLSQHIQAQRTVTRYNRVAPLLMRKYAVTLMNKVLAVPVETADDTPFVLSSVTTQDTQGLEQLNITATWKERSTEKEVIFVTAYTPVLSN
jgi:prepilin-type N-terminal cleavage/methylation domain-containing protein